MAKPKGKGGDATTVVDRKAGGGGGSPRLARGGRVEQRKPKLPKSPPFWLVFMPARWTVLAGEVVPLLQEYKLEHGVNGVLVQRDPETNDDVYDVEGAEANIRSKGGTKLEWDVDGPDTSYIVEAGQAGSGIWVTRWMHTTPGSSHVLADERGYVDWLRDLQERGILPLPQAHHLEQLIQGIRFDIEKSTADARNPPHRIIQLRAALEVLERELEEAKKREDIALDERRGPPRLVKPPSKKSDADADDPEKTGGGDA